MSFLEMPDLFVFTFYMVHAGSNQNLLLQQIAVEALVHATSKKDKCKGIVNTAIPILKKLYKESPSDSIKVRSLVVCNLPHGLIASLLGKFPVLIPISFNTCTCHYYQLELPTLINLKVQNYD